MPDGSWLNSEGRLRAGWRIAIYFALFFLFLFVGQLAASIMPRDPLGWVGLIVSTAAAVAAGGIVLSRYDGRPLGALGFPWVRAALPEIGWGFLVGGALLAGAWALLAITGTAGFVDDSGGVAAYLGVLGWTLAFFAIAAAFEEALFRGYAFQALVEAIGTWPAVGISSALFAWAHGQNPNVTPLALANIFLAGVLLALAYLRTRSLWFATAVHVGWNWTMATLLDFPVSGLTVFDTPLYTAVETGSDWWTGGAFGPEAGVAGTLAIAAGVVWLLRSPRFAEPEHMRALGPIVDRRLGPTEP